MVFSEGVSLWEATLSVIAQAAPREIEVCGCCVVSLSGVPPCLGSGGVLIRDPGGCMPVWRTVQGGLALSPEGSCRDITADLTRTYSGRCIEVNGTGLGERSIESLWRIQLSI